MKRLYSVIFYGHLSTLLRRIILHEVTIPIILLFLKGYSVTLLLTCRYNSSAKWLQEPLIVWVSQVEY